MPNRMQRAIGRALATTARVAGGDITYARGAATVTFAATFGRSQYDVIGNDGSTTRVVARDFLCDPALLVLSSTAVLPQRNDLITATINGTAARFQVLEVNGQCYEMDPQRGMLRIHTKEINAA